MLKWIQVFGFLGLSLFSFAAKAELVHCASNGYRYNSCAINGYADTAYLVRQTSRTNCVEGQNWGFDNNSIWVSDGCSGDFEVISEYDRGDRGGYPGYPDDPWRGRRDPRYPGYPGYGRDRTEQIQCNSQGYRYNTCATRSRGRIVTIQLIRQLSRTKCEYGRTYGVSGNYIWVDQGCRGDFAVRIRGGY